MIQVGQCGNQIGENFWHLASLEQARYGCNLSADTFFRQSEKGIRARGILVDMEPAVVTRIAKSRIGCLFEPHQSIKSDSGSGNNWAHGYYTHASHHREQIVDSIRREAEYCDSLQSFISIQSAGGGTGSGLGSFIANLIMDEYPEVYRFACTVLPSSTDDVVTSPYNR